MFPLFGQLGQDTIQRLFQGDLHVNKLYNQLYAILALFACAILGISFIGDVLGQNWINIVIIPIWVLAVLWLKFYPRALVGVIAASTVASKAGLIASIEAGYEKWDHFTKHAALFGGVFGLTRFLVPIKEHPFMGLLLLGALITLGLWAWLYGAGKWYKGYVLVLVLVSLAVAVFGTITGSGESTGGGLTGLAGGLKGYSKTLEIEIASLQPHKLCGVRPGERKFATPHKSYIRISGNDYEFTSYVRMNGSFPNEGFVVDGTGCVLVSFAFESEVRKQPIDPRMLQIALK